MKTLSSQQKVIFHIDGDAFFVGVEIAKNPKLKGLPVVTGEERGIVSALSYEAKALGVVRGMPIFRLKQQFPQVIILPGDYRAYVEYSSKMFDIVRRYAYGVEEYSIDECFADFTGLDRTLKKSYVEIAAQIKKEINNELGISVSIGLAPTKVLAKVASNWQKPNGLTEILPETAHEFLVKVPVKKVWGIGPKTSEQLIAYGINTALEFATKDISWIKKYFSKPYEMIWRELNGEMLMEVNTELKESYSSIQKTRSFHPQTNDKTFLWSQLSKHIEDACMKARYYGLVPKKISIFLKTKDFKYMASTIALPVPSSSPEILNAFAHTEFEKIYKKGIMYRTTGVILVDLMSNFVFQKDLFGGTLKAEKFEEIHKQIDLLEEKLGKKIIHLGSTHNALKQKTLGTDSDDLDRDLLFL
ncbi:MAG: DNA polymerase IV [Candidatus Paceibacterota bacterium]|jgi:DNA polymerase-4/DNA polymerase V